MTGVETSEDGLLGRRIVLKQPKDGYRAAIDPVLLAAVTDAATGGQVVELGCGVGAATLCLACRRPDLSVIGLERQPQMAVLARGNLAANGMAERTGIIPGDLRALPADLARNAQDAVMMNPPFLNPARHPAPPSADRAAAHSESDTTLSDWLDAARRLLRQGGALSLIHRADRLDEVLHTAMPRFGSFRVIPLWPKPGRPARRVLLTARKGGKAPLRLDAGLVLHHDDGTFTETARRILEDGLSLDDALHNTGS